MMRLDLRRAFQVRSRARQLDASQRPALPMAGRCAVG